MEEICHVFLGHQPNRLSVVTKDERGRVLNRDYRKADEEASIWRGRGCACSIRRTEEVRIHRESAPDIARHFRVSRELVEYRLKVTRLWNDYKKWYNRSEQFPQRYAQL